MVFAVLIALGAILLAVTHTDPEPEVFAREPVYLIENVGTMTSIDLRRGHYEIWIEDKNPDEQDYGHFMFEMEGDRHVHIERSDGFKVEMIDGIPHELYCTFQISRSDSYTYDTWCEGSGHDGEYFEIVFVRRSVWTNQPAFWVGFTLIIAGSFGIVISVSIGRERISGQRT